MLLTLTTLFWAGNWVIGRGMQGSMSPIAMAFWRWLAALALLLPFVGRAILAERRTLLRAWKPMLALGVLGVGAFNTLTYTGLHYTTATNGVLLNSVTPVLILAVARIFLNEKVRRLQVAGVGVSFCGVLLIMARGEWRALADLSLNPGDLWVLAAVTDWAVYTVCLRWRPQGLSSAAFTGSLILIGVLALVPLFAWDYAQGSRTQWSPHTFAAVAYFAVFPSVLAYFFWNAAVAQVGGSRAGIFMHLVPLFGALLSVVFLHERLMWYHYAGALLIFSGVFAASRRRSR